MRSLLNGVVSFGLVNVPVGIGTTGKRRDPSFRTLHRGVLEVDGDGNETRKECLQPIHEQKVCDVCGVTCDASDLVKGYEFTKGNFIVVEEGELEPLQPVKTPVITLHKFAPAGDLNPLQVEKSYYLIPNSKLYAPYAMLYQAMGAQGVVGLGKAVLWKKEVPCAIVPVGRVLTIAMLYCADELASDEDFAALTAVELDAAQMGLAQSLVEALTERVVDDDLTTGARVRMDEYLAARVQGVKYEMPEPTVEPMPTIDITQALRESIAEVQARREKIGV